MIDLGKAYVVLVSDKARTEQDFTAALSMFSTWEIVTCPKEGAAVKEALAQGLVSKAPVIITAGGTGLAPDNVTPEMIASLGGALIPGIGELLRREGFALNPNALLGRGGGWRLQNQLCLALSGSPRAFSEQLAIIKPLLAPAIAALNGRCEKRNP